MKYDYECKSCGQSMTIAQQMGAEAVTGCPVCDAQGLRRVVYATAVHYKGRGFYATDKRIYDKVGKGVPEDQTSNWTPEKGNVISS